MKKKIDTSALCLQFEGEVGIVVDLVESEDSEAWQQVIGIEYGYQRHNRR